jgi:AhpD family alkylhydroperoxidase
MQRIPLSDKDCESDKCKALLAAVASQLGGVPNIFATMAQSPAALDGLLGFSSGLSAGTFPAVLRQQIALAVAGANASDYCASLHFAIGKRLGLSTGEAVLNLKGKASDPKVHSALALSRLIVSERGKIRDADLARFRVAGYDDEELVELVANVSINIFTNYFNHIAGTEIDFPYIRATSAVPQDLCR